MKVAVFSDSGGNLGALKEAFDYCYAEERVDRLFHLGNRFADVEALIALERSLQKGSADYDDKDFLSDVTSFMAVREDLKEAPPGSVVGDPVVFLRDRVVRVPEPGCSAYEDPVILKKAVEMMGSLLLLLVHDPKLVTKEDLENADAVLYGKSCAAGVREVGPKIFVNPGHLLAEPVDGHPPSFAVLENAGRQEILVRLLGLDRGEIFKQSYAVHKATKFSAK